MVSVLTKIRSGCLHMLKGVVGFPLQPEREMGMHHGAGRGKASGAAEQTFQERTVRAMATEMAEAHKTMTTACVQFAALAASLGITIEFDHIRK